MLSLIADAVEAEHDITLPLTACDDLEKLPTISFVMKDIEGETEFSRIDVSVFGGSVQALWWTFQWNPATTC